MIVVYLIARQGVFLRLRTATSTFRLSTFIGPKEASKVLKEKIYMLVLVVICNLDSALVLKS